MVRRIELSLSGRVQGVYFRASTREIAQTLGLAGYAKNLASGDVEIVAEGEEAALKQLIEWARRGPPSARVESVEVEWKEPSGEFFEFATR